MSTPVDKKKPIRKSQRWKGIFSFFVLSASLTFLSNIESATLSSCLLCVFFETSRSVGGFISVVSRVWKDGPFFAEARGCPLLNVLSVENSPFFFAHAHFRIGCFFSTHVLFFSCFHTSSFTASHNTFGRCLIMFDVYVGLIVRTQPNMREQRNEGTTVEVSRRHTTRGGQTGAHSAFHHGHLSKRIVGIGKERT